MSSRPRPSPAPAASPPLDALDGRWPALARAVGLEPGAPVVVALSGGADSVLLLALRAAARARATDRTAGHAPEVLAVHVDHALRGAESRADARFCRRLCAGLDVPLVVRRAPVEPGPSLEERARVARYRALATVARERGLATILTGHHADDALETLLLRLVRGTHLAGLAGPRARTALAAPAGETAPGGAEPEPRTPLFVARPLLGLRRAQVRAALRARGLAWREDSSNADPRFTRNRVRHGLVPLVARLCGPAGLADLAALGAAVEGFEARCAARTAHLAWTSAADDARRLELDRAGLAALPAPLRRRALWRLLVEATGGRAPGAALLARLDADLAAGRRGRHTLPGGFRLALGAHALRLAPPASRAPASRAPASRAPASRDPAEPARPARLAVPGRVLLADGRAIAARPATVAADREPPRTPEAVELDAARLGAAELVVRAPRPGDRLHPLGAPGSRRLVRFLADAGVPRAERPHVPLVVARAGGREEIVWVAGVRPAHGWRVLPGTRRRLRLELRPAPAGPGRPADAAPR